MFDLQRSRSWSQSAIFAFTLFDGKCQTLQVSLTFFFAYVRFRDIQISNLLPLKVNQGYEVQFNTYTIRWKLLKSTNVSHTFFALAFTVSDIYTHFKIVYIFAITSFDGNCQNLQMSPIFVLR